MTWSPCNCSAALTGSGSAPDPTVVRRRRERPAQRVQDLQRDRRVRDPRAERSCPGGQHLGHEGADRDDGRERPWHELRARPPCRGRQVHVPLDLFQESPRHGSACWRPAFGGVHRVDRVLARRVGGEHVPGLGGEHGEPARFEVRDARLHGVQGQSRPLVKRSWMTSRVMRGEFWQPLPSVARRWTGSHAVTLTNAARQHGVIPITCLNRDQSRRYLRAGRLLP